VEADGVEDVRCNHKSKLMRAFKFKPVELLDPLTAIGARFIELGQIAPALSLGIHHVPCLVPTTTLNDVS
jgi:hypothetical protein